MINILYDSKLENPRLEIIILLLIKKREVVEEELITNKQNTNKLVDNYKIKTSQSSNYNRILVEFVQSISVASKHLEIRADQKSISILSTLE